MKIGILGWYYQNNAGDDRILDCLKRKSEALGATDVHVFIAWDELETNVDKINTCDFLLVGGGGLILRNTNRVAVLLEKVTIPWAFIGISIDSVGDDNILFIKYISSHAKFVIVRDKYSFDVFKEHNSEGLYLAPDLTFLYPFKKPIDSASTNTVAVSLRPWKPNLFKQYTKNYHRFNKLTHKLPVLTQLLGLWDLSKFSNVVKENTTLKIQPFPLHINSKNGDNLLFQNHFGADQNLEFNINHLKESDYLIGMRLHSLIFATQLGIPFIAVSYATKIDNFLQDMGMSNFVVSVNDYKKLPQKLDQLKLKKADISKKLLQVSERNELEINKIVEQVFKQYILC